MPANVPTCDSNSAPDSRRAIRRTVIHEESLPCDVPLNELDMDWLRRQYSTLFDRAAQAIFRQGLDLDDVIVERMATLRIGNNTFELELPSVNDRDRIERALARAAPSGGYPIHAAGVMLEQISVVVVCETL